MSRRVNHYSNFLTDWAALVGVPVDRISTEVAASANALFNTAITKIWNYSPWLEVCPYGEARFAGNRLTYANAVNQTSAWTATAVTITANSVANPCDGRTTAAKVMETAANSAHKIVQSVTTFFPNTSYTVSFYARPNGRSYQYLSVTDGVTTYTAFFNTTTGVVGTTANFTSTQMSQQPNGFWLCQATFTANAAATTSGSYTIQSSSDGSTLTYAGDTSKGFYLWGNLVQQTSNVPLNDCVVAWDQTGESVIDTVFDVYATSPFTAQNPPLLGYTLNGEGIQLINATPYPNTYYVNGVAQSSNYGLVPANPVFVYYRKSCPRYTGDEYSATDTYAVDDQIYFTSSTGYGDYYKCVVATTAGQSPDTTPDSWELLPLWDTFFEYTVFQTYADWLISDGQQDKAAGMYSIAQSKMDDQLDKLERQSGQVLPIKVQSHLTAQTNYGY